MHMDVLNWGKEEKKSQIESFTPDVPLLRSPLLFLSDVPLGYDLRVLR